MGEKTVNLERNACVDVGWPKGWTVVALIIFLASEHSS